MASFLEALGGQQPAAASSFLAALAKAPAPTAPQDPSAGSGEFELWNPFGSNLDLHVKTPQAVNRTLAGIGQGLTTVARHAGNLVGLESNAALNRAQQLDQPLLNTTAGKVGNFIGTTAATLPLMGGIGGAADAAGGILGRVAANTLGRGALEGAAQGLLLSDPGQKVGGLLGGAASGTALPLLGKLGSTAIRGLARTPEAQALLNRGIDLTPGLLNPGGQRNLSEEAAQSLPLVGAMIRRARQAPIKQFQQSVVREGAAPGATIQGSDIHDMLDSAYQSFQPLYAQARGYTKIIPAIVKEGENVPLNAVFRGAVSDRGVLASAPERRMVAGFLDNEASRFNGTSDSLLDMRSNVRAKIRELKLDGKTAPAQLLQNAEKGLTQSLESQLQPRDLQALRTADSKYGQYKVIEDAVARSKDRPEGMSATHLSEAVKAATPKPLYARGGGGPLRDLAREGKEVFDVRSPPTGARVETMLPGMAAVHAHPLLAAPAALARLALTATKPGRALAAGTTPAQRALQSRLNAALLANPLLLQGLGRAARGAIGSASIPALISQMPTGQ